MGFKSYAGAAGSFRGAASVGTGGTQNAAGSAMRGSGMGPGGWHPTVLYMLGLIVAEVIAVGILSRTLLR